MNYLTDALALAQAICRVMPEVAEMPVRYAHGPVIAGVVEELVQKETCYGVLIAKEYRWTLVT